MKAFQAYSEENGSGHKGFQLTFANGLTVSVMFGYRNYCENRDSQTNEGSKNAEFVVFGQGEREYLFADGMNTSDGSNPDVGWKSPDQVAKGIALVATWPSDIERDEACQQLHKLFGEI